MLGELLTITAALCWALSVSLYKKSLLNVRPVTLNLFRSFSATIYAFLVLYLLGKWSLLSKLDLVSVTYIGISSILILVVGDIFYFIGLKSVGVAKTVPIAYSYSIFVALISTIFLGELLTAPILLGTIAVVLGIWLVAGQAENKGSQQEHLKLGVLAALGTSLCWACGISIFKTILADTDPFLLVSVRMLFALPVLGVLTILPSGTRSSTRHLTRFNILTMFLSGLVAIGVGDTFFLIGLETTKANVAAPLASTTPLFAAIIAILFLKEEVSKRVVVGTFFVTAGMMLLTLEQMFL
ncbi:MAG: DMT family transporter [Candidatus Bathyarchaeota archaeon]|nr:MAG: DMT family transporter [Candidatus Bathyarchaeota archaeon]